MTLPFPRPSTLSPKFSISAIENDDVDAVIKCHHNAFCTPAKRFWWSPDLDVMSAYHKSRLQKNLRDADMRYYKITHDADGEVVAWASWALPKGFRGLPRGGAEKPATAASAGSGTAASGGKTNGVATGAGSSFASAAGAGAEGGGAGGGSGGGGPNVPPVGAGKAIGPVGNPDSGAKKLTPKQKVDKIKDTLPEGAKGDALGPAILMSMEIQERHGAEIMPNLTVLNTVPKYERQGLARALVQPVLDAAQVEGRSVWVDSSPEGKGFYEKMGFETVEAYEIDLGAGNTGLTGLHTVTGMKWTPKSLVNGKE